MDNIARDIAQPEGHFHVRKAEVGDIPSILRLIETYKFRGDGTGFLIPLEEAELNRRITQNQDFFVAHMEEYFAGCVSIVEYSGIAELRTLVVEPRYQRRGIGSVLIQQTKQESQKRDYGKLFTLTNPAAYALFYRLGFDKTEFPQKLERDCHDCPLYEDSKCSEIAMIALLSEESA